MKFENLDIIYTFHLFKSSLNFKVYVRPRDPSLGEW